MENELEQIAREAAAEKAAREAVPVEVVSQPSPMADLERQVGLTGRSMAQGAAGLVGLAYDPIAAVQNLLIGPEGVMPMMSEDVRPLREQVRETLTAAGVPEPETATERVVLVVSKRSSLQLWRRL